MTSKRRIRVLGSVLVNLAIVLVVVTIAVAFGQRFVLFPRPGPPDEDRAARISGLERLMVGEAPSVEAWLLGPIRGEGPHPLVIFAHGNGELIDLWAPLFGPLREAGFGVLLVEYPGYGRSGGSPSQASITRAFVAAYDRMLERPDVRRDAIVGYGRSLGGGAIAQLAQQRPLAGIIFESSFRGVRPIARGLGVPGWLIRDPFDSEAILADFHRPILLLHGERDTIVPVEHSHVLHRIAPDSELHTFPCGHNDCPRPWPQILDFLTQRLAL